MVGNNQTSIHFKLVDLVGFGVPGMDLLIFLLFLSEQNGGCLRGNLDQILRFSCVYINI